MTPEVQQPQEVSRQNGLGQAIDCYKQSVSFLDLAENTRLGYTADFAQFQKYCQAHNISSANQLTPKDVTGWLYQLRQDGCVPATINRKRASLRGFLNWAQAEGITRPDFTISLLPKSESVVKKQPGILSAEQVGELISKAKNLRDASLILIVLATGARVTEVINLNVGDVSEASDGNFAIRFKGGSKRPMPKPVLIEREVGNLITEYKEANGLKPEDPLFQGYNPNRESLTGRRLTRAAVDLILKRDYSPEIGIKNLNFSMLRHTFLANFTRTPR